jgi:hypothetical protein
MSSLSSRKNGFPQSGAKSGSSLAVSLAAGTQKDKAERPVIPGLVSNFELPRRATGNGLELPNLERLARLELLDREQLARVIGLSPRTVSTLKKGKKIPYLALSPRCHKYVLGDVLTALRRFEIREVGRK